MNADAKREQLETMIVLGNTLNHARLQSIHASNMSQAARAAGLTPSYLHRIENGDVLPSADAVLSLMQMYDEDPSPVLWLLKTVDAEIRAAIMAYMARYGREELLRTIAAPARETGE